MNAGYGARRCGASKSYFVLHEPGFIINSNLHKYDSRLMLGGQWRKNSSSVAGTDRPSLVVIELKTSLLMLLLLVPSSIRVHKAAF